MSRALVKLLCVMHDPRRCGGCYAPADDVRRWHQPRCRRKRLELFLSQLRRGSTTRGQMLVRHKTGRTRPRGWKCYDACNFGGHADTYWCRSCGRPEPQPGDPCNWRRR